MTMAAQRQLTRRCSQPLAAPLLAFIRDVPLVDHNPLLGCPFGVAELDDGQNEMRSLRMRTPESKMGA